MTLREPPNCLNYSPTVWSGTLKASCKLKPFLASRQKTNHLTLRRLLSLRGLVKDPEGTKNRSSLLVQSGFSLTPSSFSWMIPMAVLTVQQFKWEELIYQCAFNEEHPHYLTLTWRQTRDWDHGKDSSAENSSLIIKQASFFPFFCPSPPLHHPQLGSTPLPSSLHVVFLSSSARVAQFDCLEGLRIKETDLWDEVVIFNQQPAKSGFKSPSWDDLPPPAASVCQLCDAVFLTEHSNLNSWMNHGDTRLRYSCRKNLYHTAELLTSQSALIIVHNLMDSL